MPLFRKRRIKMHDNVLTPIHLTTSIYQTIPTVFCGFAFGPRLGLDVSTAMGTKLQGQDVEEPRVDGAHTLKILRTRCITVPSEGHRCILFSSLCNGLREDRTRVYSPLPNMGFSVRAASDII